MSDVARVEASPDPRRSARWALAGLSLSMLMSSLDTSIANAGLPTLARAFGASFQQVQWVVLAYLLSITTLVVGAGRLGDLVGRRRLLLAGTALFTAASGLCGIAPSLGVLIAARAAQGLGAAAMMALTVAFVAETASKENAGSAMGLLGTMSAIGTALGPSLGGLLVSGVGWRAMFLVNLPVGALALFLTHRYLPSDGRSHKAEPGGFDYLGTALLALALAAYALAMTTGHGRFGPLNLALLAASFVGLLVFALVESRTKFPLLSLSTFRTPGLKGSLVMSTIVATVMMSTLVVGPFYLAHALRLEPALVGLALSVGPVVVALAGMPAGRLADRFGAARTTAFGLVAMACGLLLLTLSSTALGVPGYVGPVVVVTAGYALFQTSNNTLVMGGLSPAQRGVTAGMLGLARNLGLITGASAMGAVFAFASGATTLGNATPEAVAGGTRATFAVAATLVLAATVISLKGGPALRASCERTP